MQEKLSKSCNNGSFDGISRILENFGKEFLNSLDEESFEYLVIQLEALEKIEELENEARDYAHELLAMKDEEGIEPKYTPVEALKYATQGAN